MTFCSLDNHFLSPSLKCGVGVLVLCSLLHAVEEPQHIKDKRHAALERAIGGDVSAMIQLADQFLLEGDDELASKWFQRAADQGETSALWKLIGITEHLPLAERVEPIMALYRKVMEHGDPRGNYRLGRLHAWENSPVKDERLADLYLTDASDLGVTEAQVLLGKLFMGEWGHSVDHLQSIFHFKRAAEADDGEAHRYLGMMYRYGLGDVIDLEKAWVYYAKGARLGNIDAMYDIAEALYHGDDINQDRPRALKYYNQASKLGHTLAGKRIKELEF